MIIVLGIIAVLVIVGVIKFFCRDVTLTVCLILLLSYPLALLATWVVSYSSKLGNTIQSSSDALKIFGMGLIGIIILIAIIIDWFKKKAERDFSEEHD